MVKHTQKIFWQQPTNCLSVFDHFVGLALKGLSQSYCNRKTWPTVNIVGHEEIFAKF